MANINNLFNKLNLYKVFRPAAKSDLLDELRQKNVKSLTSYLINYLNMSTCSLKRYAGDKKRVYTCIRGFYGVVLKIVEVQLPEDTMKFDLKLEFDLKLD